MSELSLLPVDAETAMLRSVRAAATQSKFNMRVIQILARIANEEAVGRQDILDLAALQDELTDVAQAMVADIEAYRRDLG